MGFETSIIIRAKNEEKWLGKVLEMLFKQTYQDFEVIVIDSGSTDKTLEIAQKFPVKILTIPSKDFSYPYALNYAIKRAKATKYLVILSAHSVPASNNWLEESLKNFTRFDHIAGVYGPIKSLPGSSFWDQLFGKVFYWCVKYLIERKEQLVISKGNTGVLGFTNAIILKELWNKKHFNEDWGRGGEDGKWVGYWFNHGYKVVKDYNFTVYHSHNLGLISWYHERNYWFKDCSSPAPYRPRTYIGNTTHQSF